MESKNYKINAKYCPVCKNRIKGRSDKKFCSNDCRARHHNSNNRQNKSFANTILKTLNTNRRILEDLYRKGVFKIPVTLISSIGFNMHFYTHTISSTGRNQIRYIFDIGYKIDGDSIKIISADIYDDLSVGQLKSPGDFRVA